HFLKDQNIARKIVDSLAYNQPGMNVLEVGPGMGVLTQYLLQKDIHLKAVEIDRESVTYLRNKFEGLDVVETDFLQSDPAALFDGPLAIIGNFPYNISSQIFFKVL